LFSTGDCARSKIPASFFHAELKKIKALNAKKFGIALNAPDLGQERYRAHLNRDATLARLQIFRNHLLR